MAPSPLSRRGPHRRIAAAAATMAFLVAACTGSMPVATTTTQATSTLVPPATTVGTTTVPPPKSTVPVPTYVDGNGFNDHTVPVVESLPEFFALARPGVSGQSAVKFTIAEMSGSARLSWMDSNFYSLHDEWYWFRLLNGQSVPGVDTVPSVGRLFTTIGEIYAWAAAQPVGALPYDLKFVGGQSAGSRLYSDRFYDLALHQEPRLFGLGSLAYFPTSPDGGGPRWVIELEYQDAPNPEEMARFFELVAATVPTEIGDGLEWVIRSPEQEAVATAMVAASLPYHDRVVRYGELVAPGTVAVYNEGIAAGRLLLIGDDGKDITDAGENDILLIENAPDWLPPGRALITSAPQTPLAHVNLLARNRGIPNASQSGILQDAGIQQAARVRAPAIVRASASEGLQVVLITEAEYKRWQSLNQVVPASVPPVDLFAIPDVIDLADITGIESDAAIAAWRPIIGGKAAGFINLMASGEVNLPENPLAITVKPYFEHLAKVDAALDAMLADSAFRVSTRIRYLMLEGAGAYAAAYPRQADRDYADAFAASHPAGSPVRAIIDAGGFKSYLRSFPIELATLRALTAALEGAFGDYSLGQGLRFRSSSSAEDIEGFNGAGLYVSNTGFFRPDIQLDDKDQKKSIEWALKATWSSYWGFEAFEERRRGGVDHRSGGMAVLVHARFEDPLELANGVATFTVMPAGSPDDFVMMLNAQEGTVSVANPDAALGALPEVVTVRQSGAATPVIERIAESNLVPAGFEVLDNPQIAELFAGARAVALLWRDRINASLPFAMQIQTLTLDLEFKEMAAGWPVYRGGGVANPPRIVFKQARTLEPGIRGVPGDVAALPIRRDVLARARVVARVTCPASSGGEVVTVEVLTDALSIPDVGYSQEPFVIVERAGIVADESSCARDILYSTADQFLIELLAIGALLNLSK